MVQEEVQAAYTALQVAEDRSASLQTQLEAASLEASAAANKKVSSNTVSWHFQIWQILLGHMAAQLLPLFHSLLLRKFDSVWL